MKRFLTTVVLIVCVVPFVAPFSMQAQEDETSSDEIRRVLQDRIDELRQQIAKLAEQVVDKRHEQFERVSFDRNLFPGSEGEDVRVLQEFLADYTQFYPEKLVTGYYGTLTSAAVDRYKAEYGIVESGFGEKTRESLERLFESRETFAVSVPSEFLNYSEETDEEEFDLEDVEREIHDQVNKIREEEELGELEWDEELADVARQHSHNQLRDNELTTNKEHICQYPLIRHEGFENGFKVRDRVEHADIEYRSVGENIAMVPLVESRTYSYDDEDINCPEKDLVAIESAEDEEEYFDSLRALEERIEEIGEVTFLKHELYEEDEVIDLAVEGWMESEGHRENVLYEGYTHAGIGIERINNYLIITHNFIGK